MGKEDGVPAPKLSGFEQDVIDNPALTEAAKLGALANSRQGDFTVGKPRAVRAHAWGGALFLAATIALGGIGSGAAVLHNKYVGSTNNPSATTFRTEGTPTPSSASGKPPLPSDGAKWIATELANARQNPPPSPTKNPEPTATVIAEKQLPSWWKGIKIDIKDSDGKELILDSNGERTIFNGLMTVFETQSGMNREQLLDYLAKNNGKFPNFTYLEDMNYMNGNRWPPLVRNRTANLDLSKKPLVMRSTDNTKGMISWGDHRLPASSGFFINQDGSLEYRQRPMSPDITSLALGLNLNFLANAKNNKDPEKLASHTIGPSYLDNYINIIDDACKECRPDLKATSIYGNPPVMQTFDMYPVSLSDFLTVSRPSDKPAFIERSIFK